MTKDNAPCHALSRRAMLGGGALALGYGLSGGVAWAHAGTATAPAANMAGQWPAVTALANGVVDAHQLPGALACLGWGATPPGVIARGTLAFDNAAPLDGDSLYRVYSMTKPLTGLLAAMLIDEGRMALDQNLADFAPEFSAMRVATHPGTSLDAVPAKVAVTIRHCLTHTAGFGYGGLGKDAVSLELARLGVVPARVSRGALPGLPPPVPTQAPDEFLRRAAGVPLRAAPGTRWLYSMGLDIIGLIIARIEGKPLELVMAERLFGPLGMQSSFFRVPAGEAHRLTTNYGESDGVTVPIDPARGSVYLDPPAFAFGGAGLVTSARDYDRFLAAIVNNGKALDGTQAISAKAVALAAANLLPAGADTAGTTVAGHGFGAGARVGTGADAGLYGWEGAAGTLGFADRRLGLRGGFYLQVMPGEAFGARARFADAVRSDALARPPQEPDA